MACGKSPALSISCFSILVLNLPFSFQTSDYCRFTVQDFSGNMKESNILRLIFSLTGFRVCIPDALPASKTVWECCSSELKRYLPIS